MITDDANNLLKTTILNNLSGSVKSLIQYSSILLTGAGFTGSGVILNKDTDKKKFCVLTAKHNLLITAKLAHSTIVKPAEWVSGQKIQNTTTLTDYFKANVRVSFRAADMTQEEPSAVNGLSTINSITLFDDWDYDVCLLTVNYVETCTPRSALFTTSNTSTLKELISKQEGFINVLPISINSNEQIGGIRKYQFIQTGYGYNGQGEAADYSGTLDKYQLKATELKSHAARNVYDASVGTYQDVFDLNSNRDCTSRAGDSGGPVFGVELATENIYLLGVALGSDYFPTEDDEPADIKTVPDGTYNNDATSLMLFYEKITSS